MTRYLVARIVAGLVTLYLFVTVLFFVINAAVPGDWTSQFILTAEQRSSFQQQLGLDRSLWEQYWSWIGAVFTLDLGVSLGGEPVWQAIQRALASTLLVLLVGLSVAFVFGSWLGRLTTWSRRRTFGATVTFVAILFLSAFPPALGFLLERAAVNSIGRAAFSRMRSFDTTLWLSDMSPPALVWRMHLTLLLALAMVLLVSFTARRLGRRVPRGLLAGLLLGGPVTAWIVLGWTGRIVDEAARLVLITFALVILTFGEVVLITRATMEDTVAEDFVTVALAKGLPEQRVRDHHAARAALLPTMSRLVVAIPYLLTGLVILESVFGVGGMGTLIFNALRLQDTPLIAGALLVVGVLTVLLRIGLDLAHAALDPRIRQRLEQS